MSVFGNYARYYNLLYQDKDYVGETHFVQQLIQRHAPGTQSILDLGCGTGNHAMLLAKEGYQVHGVDLSADMLHQAQDHRSHLPAELQARLQFSQGDIRQVRLNQTFDLVLSLFHVISYQTTNEDLLAAFETVKLHLKPGGIFIFDVWYGPAVLTEHPTVRVKRLEDGEILVTRIAEPVMDPNKNLVDVNYQVFIRDKHQDSVEELNETHRMRYLFTPEIELLLQLSNIKMIEFCGWMNNTKPGFDTWGVCYIAQGENQ